MSLLTQRGLPMLQRKKIFSICTCLMTWAMLLLVRPLLAQQSNLAGQDHSSGMATVEGTGRETEGEEPELEGEGEEVEEIETDRDSFTPATTTVRRGRIMLESAYSFIDNRSVPETHSVPEIVARYGLTDNIELRFGWNYEIGGVGSPISGDVPESGATEAELEEEAKLLYGAKFFLTEQRGWTPQSSFIVQGFTPTFGESNLTAVSATHVFGWKLRNGWTWDSATRFGTSGSSETLISPEDHFIVWAPSTVIKIPLNERVKAHAEYFGVFSEGREVETTQHFFSPGVHYLINRDLEVGIRVGWGLNEQSPNFFTNVGFGWQF